MSKVIVYVGEDERVWVLSPSPESVHLYGLEAIAMKDVPQGRPFKIMDASQVPPKPERASWTIDPATLTDGVGGNFTSFE